VPPRAEQDIIAGYLAHTDSKLSAENNRLVALETLSASLLNNLMTGKVKIAGLDLITAPKKVRKRSPLADIFNKWPSDETDEEVRRALEGHD